MRRLNWPLWTGLLLSFAAFFSYFSFFYQFPITRDVPWVSFLLFAVAIVLLIAGLRRAQRKLVPWIVMIAGTGVAVFFCLVVLVLARQLPASASAPAVGQKAPDFTLPDTARNPVTLSALIAQPHTKGVLLVFYRGYW
jgi:hypothetical protein